MHDAVSALIVALAVVSGALAVTLLLVGWLSDVIDRQRRRIQELFAENRSLKEAGHG